MNKIAFCLAIWASAKNNTLAEKEGALLADQAEWQSDVSHGPPPLLSSSLVSNGEVPLGQRQQRLLFWPKAIETQSNEDRELIAGEVTPQYFGVALTPSDLSVYHHTSKTQYVGELLISLVLLCHG